MATTTGDKSSVIVVGIDDSDHSFYALQWTLDNVILQSSPSSKLFIIFAKPSPTSTVSIAGPAAVDVIPYVDADLKKTASRVLDKAKDLCYAKSVKDVALQSIEGDARNVLCEAVDKHHATLLVVGSHGYGAIKRAVLGSVSDYCVHHAHCSVMIVKKPKVKH